MPCLPQASLSAIRIVFVVHSLAWGGIERILLAICRELRSKGHQPSIACLTNSGSMATEFEKAGIPLTIFGGHSSCSIRYGPSNVFAFFSLFHYLRRVKPHVVQTQMFYAGVMGRAAALCAGVTSIIHTEHNEYDWKGPIARWIDRFLMHRSSAIIVPSVAVATFLSQQLNVPLDTIKVFHNGIDRMAATRSASSIRQENGLSTDNIVIGMSARLVPQKGHEDFIHAIAKLAPSLSRLRGVIVGDGPDRSKLESLVSNLGISDRVLFLGNVPCPGDIYQIMDIFVAPSRREGFGLSVAEAMLAFVPVVLSRINPFVELFKDANCQFVEIGDVKGWAQTIEKLLSKPEECLQLARRGEKLVRERYSLEAMLLKYLGLYRTLCERKSQKGASICD